MGTQKKETSGFFSRMATLFRDNASEEKAPATESSQEPSDADYARMQEALQASKRRDDQVRKREFNHLRKLRKSGIHPQAINSTGTPRPSVFQASSSFGPQERFVTLQKINAIESTIVQSWNQAKKQAATPPAAADPVSSTPMPPAPLPETLASPPQEDFDLDFTAMELPTLPPAQHEPPVATAPTEHSLGVLEHTLQEAAMRFAEGDSDAAARGLQAVYQDTALPTQDAALLGHALFDLYRSTGAHAPFETLALDYAQRLGRSPAEWFSLPELLDQHEADMRKEGEAAFTPQSGGQWSCPPTLDATTIEGLQERFLHPDAPSVLHWGALQVVAEDANGPFAALLAHWKQHSTRMQWTGEHALLHALEKYTSQEARNTDPLWWHLHLDILCLLQRQTAFENLALEYCVLFEESPPSWKDFPDLVAQPPSLADYASVISTLLPLETASPPWQDLRCVLYGEAIGKANPTLEALEAVALSASQITVDCTLLWRIDFDAASAMVDWAQQRAAQGCEIEFTQLTHLLAVLLHTVGLDAYAQLSIRRQ